MTKKPDGGAAFPRETSLSQFSGMSLRDYFAGQAMVANIAALENARSVDEAASMVAGVSYKMADAMIAARDAK